MDEKTLKIELDSQAVNFKISRKNKWKYRKESNKSNKKKEKKLSKKLKVYRSKVSEKLNKLQILKTHRLEN